MEEKHQSIKHMEKQLEELENALKLKKVEAEDTVKKLEMEEAKVKVLKDKSIVENKSASSQTSFHPDIPYKVTDPLPPIFSMQLRHKTQPIHFLSRSIPNLNSILWCPPDDEYIDEFDEYLNEQYDRGIKDFYIEAREKAFARHREEKHAEDQAVPEHPESAYK